MCQILDWRECFWPSTKPLGNVIEKRMLANSLIEERKCSWSLLLKMCLGLAFHVLLQ